jgi:Lrp/AsnC family transcriptional regulator for asnA, asnC and gidA
MKSKTKKIILDGLDRKILQILQENAKQTYTEIGNKLNVAHSTVFDRIRRMEEERIIKKYEAIFDLEKIGTQQITALMIIKAAPKETENIAKRLAEYGEISEVFTAFSDELVISAKMVTRDQTELHSFIAKLIAPLSGVLNIRTTIVTRKYKEERASINISKEEY